MKAGDFIAVTDSIYERQESKVKFQIKTRRLKQHQGKPVVKNATEQRFEEIEERIRKNTELNGDVADSMNVTEIRNKVHQNVYNKMIQEKFKGRFDVKINFNLPMELKIDKFLNEPIAFHLHKNRLMFTKLEPRSSDQQPLSTREIVQKIRDEQKQIDRSNRRMNIWCNTGKKLPQQEDSSDYDDYGNKVRNLPTFIQQKSTTVAER